MEKVKGMAVGHSRRWRRRRRDGLGRLLSPYLLSLMIFGLLPSLALTTSGGNGHGPMGFHDDDDSDTDTDNEIEEDVHSVPEMQVDSILGGRAEFPCDLTPSRRGDTIHMAFFFRDDFAKPIYNLDVRGKPFSAARHWSSPTMFGNRAHFRTSSEPTCLVIENVHLTDEGIYRCRVDFKNSPTRNIRFNFTVIVPPKSVTIHDDAGRVLTSVIGPIMEGSLLSLTCRSSGGKPLPRIEWRIGEEPLGSNEVLFSTEPAVLSKKLKVVQVRREHHGANLTCLTFNSNLTDPLMETLRLTLYLRPLTARITQRDRLVANQRHQIECIATGARPRAMITFWMGNRQLTDVTMEEEESLGGALRYDSDDAENVTRSSLGLVPSIEDDGQKITCKAENPWVPKSFVEDSWTLHVVYPPILSLQLGSTLNPDQIKEGVDVFFECKIKSNPPFKKLSWLFNERLLQHNVSAGIILSNQSLVLQGISRKQSGNFTCSATNFEGTSQSNPVHLRVKYAPVCKQERNVIVGVSKGERVSIKCELEADPQEVNFRWDLATSGQMIQVSPSKFVNSGSTSLLHYAPASNHDYGSLFCRGSNVVGSQMAAPCVFQIVAAEKPSQVTNCTVFNETSESVELSCDESHDGGLTQHFVLEVFESDSGELRYNASSHTPSFHLGNLTPIGTGFRVFVYSVNAKGRSEPYRIDELVIRQSEKYAAVSPSDYPWISFGLSVAIGGAAVFVCVGAVVVIRALHFRSRRLKRESKKYQQQQQQEAGKGGKNSSANTNLHERQGMELKEGTINSSDDKDPDIIPSNIGGTEQHVQHQLHYHHLNHHQIMAPSVASPSSNLSSAAMLLNSNPGMTGDRIGKSGRFHTATSPTCCLQPQQQNWGYSMDHNHQPHHHHHHQNVYGDEGGGRSMGSENFMDADMSSGAAVHHYRGHHHPHQQQGPPPGGQQHPQHQGQTTMNELDNFSTLNSLRHSTDPYFDTKLMKQKLLSINVPESCV